MQFISGLPQGVYVGQTQIQHPQALTAPHPELAGFNLALHVNDDPLRVQKHRMILLNQLAKYGANTATWMEQTHSTICHQVTDEAQFYAQEGDGLVTQQLGHVLMMMTADCLPVVLGNSKGTELANLHAGWRGLANGIIENTVASMQSQPTWAWLGAAISQPCFEVGPEVRQAFCEKYPRLDSAFEPKRNINKFNADLYAIARYILKQLNVELIIGGDQCTYRQSDRYYSYRRHANTGRMATFAFLS
ncbi:hypothetical protein EC844_10288 [Acinetobacter calcoaceticus]|uniref:Purine nucleoside phosphorylase n=1 Tax=Acinetobacter calcoaceticus TaxID=471 RepID=A0A4R1XYM2_ACICA|nr:hypothetical protein EC844_10288 [Acinetobacter calcoaceticus]